MNEERMRILKMLEEGKISVEEATQLIEAVEAPRETEIVPQGKPKWIKVRVTGAGSEKVNVNVPLSLARIALKFIPPQAKDEIEAQGIDIDAILNEVTQVGKLVEVQDGDEHVEVWIE
jgi:hypothetical protein